MVLSLMSVPGATVSTSATFGFWPTGAFAGLSVITALFLVAGVRLRAEQERKPTLIFGTAYRWPSTEEGPRLVYSVANVDGSRLEAAWPELTYHLDNGEQRVERGLWSRGTLDGSIALEPNGESHAFFLAIKDLEQEHAHLATASALWFRDNEPKAFAECRLPRVCQVSIRIRGNQFVSDRITLEISHLGQNTALSTSHISTDEVVVRKRFRRKNPKHGVAE